MQEIITEVMNSWGYIGIFFLILVENIFPPIPSEIILSLGGFMTTQSSMTVPLVILFATLGAVIGAFILYGIGRIVNKDVIKGWLDGRVGKLLCFKPQDVEKANTWFEKKGNITVLFCRCIPIVRSLISIPAGMTKMKITPFVIYTVIGTTVWNTILVVAGHFLGEAWHKVADVVDKFGNIVLVILIVAVLAFVVWHFTKKYKESKCEKIDKIKTNH